jgi:DNA-binding NarL/FixJ family response regulator
VPSRTYVHHLGCPAPIREALSVVLQDAGFSLIDGDTAVAVDSGPVVNVVYCSSEDQWSRLKSLASDSTVVALLHDLELDQYGRALALGAHGVVHVDTPSTVIASVVEAAVRSEVVLPVFVAQAFAAQWYGTTPPTDLTDHERALLGHLLAGHRVNEIADSMSYSERTIRRQLQSLYLKLGVKHRTEALAIAARMNLA